MKIKISRMTIKCYYHKSSVVPASSPKHNSNHKLTNIIKILNVFLK